MTYLIPYRKEMSDMVIGVDISKPILEPITIRIGDVTIKILPSRRKQKLIRL
jgi:hypothetical protein